MTDKTYKSEGETIEDPSGTRVTLEHPAPKRQNIGAFGFLAMAQALAYTDPPGEHVSPRDRRPQDLHAIDAHLDEQIIIPRWLADEFARPVVGNGGPRGHVKHPTKAQKRKRSKAKAARKARRKNR